MDQIITNMASLGLLVFLFAAIARRAPDDACVAGSRDGAAS
jgi:hypothetical protein